MASFAFEITHMDGSARAGLFRTPHGVIPTPVFAPVGTQATVKTIPPRDLYEINAPLILANTYHLHLRPGSELIRDLGGLHRVMAWQRPILTDSGGFQVFSLAGINKIDDDGVTFSSHIDGSRHRLTPERSMAIQENLGADIIMAFDECPIPTDRAIVERAVMRTSRWAERCREAHPDDDRQALFGIVQGGIFPDLRAQSAEHLQRLGFPGYAIGGLAVGEPQAEMLRTIAATEPFMPADKPRYLMGVGTPDDMLESIRRGVDMFDCVMPTRAGRHGTAYTRFGRLNLRNAKFSTDRRPLDEASDCPASRDYSRAYLHHLVRADEMLGDMLLTWNNLAYYCGLMAGARAAIAAGRYDDFVAETKEGWARGL
ncbi:MAG TPA: tRNA guanosine(34) transglycosylase Tgt [Aggregatilineales bacterium]|nr:tRNA guanosine(34) transglycosylase Tgt [Aggregatilineales bacterium]